MFVHIIDGAVGGNYVFDQLTKAGINCRLHAPENPRIRQRYACHDSLSLMGGVELIEQHISKVLGTNRGLFLISSYVGSLVAERMTDLRGQSHNVITCLPPDSPLPVVASSLSVKLYQQQRKLARIAGRVKHSQRDLNFLEADAALHFLSTQADVFGEECRDLLKNKPKFLASPSMIVAAHKLGIKCNEYHNYAGLVSEFIARQQR